MVYSSPMRRDTIVLVPTYNERPNVGPLSDALLQALPGLEILFIDDGSPDGTGEACDALAARQPRIHVMHRPSKQGLGRAYVAGFQWALERGYEYIFEMDADLSHDPVDVPRLRASAEHVDLALGSRFAGGIRIINWPLSRLILSQVAGAYVRGITGMPFHDPTGGFRCYRRAVIASLQLDRIASSGYAFQIETLHHAWMQGFRVEEVPIIFFERQEGRSKMSRAILWEAVFMVWRLWAGVGFRRRPRRPAPEPAPR